MALPSALLACQAMAHTIPTPLMAGLLCVAQDGRSLQGPHLSRNLTRMFSAILSIALLFVLAIVLLYRAHYLLVATKGAIGGLLCFLGLCFIYGFTQGFHFVHAGAPPGLEAALFSAYVYGLLMGPVVMLLSGLGVVAYIHAKRKGASQSHAV